MKKKNGGLLGVIVNIIVTPIFLLTNKKTRIPTLLVLALLIAVFPTITRSCSSAIADSSLSLLPYRCSEGSYDKVESKLMKYLDEENHEDAKKLMEANSWYTVKEAETSQQILDKIDNIKNGNVKWLSVIVRLDGSNDKIRTQKNEIFHSIGMGRLKSNQSIEYAAEAWSNCTEGSLGYDSYMGFSKIFAHDALEGGKILYNRSSKSTEVKEDYERAYFHHIDGVKYQDLQDYMDHMLCMGYIRGIKPAKDLKRIDVTESGPHKYLHQKPVTSDISMYQFILMEEDMRNELTDELKKSNGSGGKVLVLDRIEICGTDRVELGINGFMMRSIPEEYCAESLDEVRYVLLMDYGYLQESVWYAGTATARVFDLKTKKEIFTSETLEGEFAKSYVGEATNVIFGSYPDVTTIVLKALSAIE